MVNIIRKIRDLFLVGRGGGKHYLQHGKNYIMTRQGKIKEVESSIVEGDAGEVDTSLQVHADNPNTLLILGSRGDLRQLETIQRNVSLLFANAATVDSNFFVEPPLVEESGIMESQVVLDLGKPTTLAGVRLFLDSWGTVRLRVHGSHDGVSWDIIDFEESVTVGGVFEMTNPSNVDYRYYKKGGGTPSWIRDPVFLFKDRKIPKFLGRDEAARLSELIAETYDVSIWNEGGLFNDDALITFVAPQKISLPVGLVGSVIKALTNPSALYAMDMQHNGSTFGVLTINTSGVMTSSNSLKVFNKGDRFTLTTRAIGDASLKDLAMTLVFDRVTA